MSSPFRGRWPRSGRRGPTRHHYPETSPAPPTEHPVLGRGSLQADCSCISGGLRPPDTPCFPGRTPSSPGPSGRGTTSYVPLDPLCRPGAANQHIARFEAWCLIPGQLSGLGFDGLRGRPIDGCAPDSSLCSLTLTLRTTRSRPTQPIGTTGLPSEPQPPQSPPPSRGRWPRSGRRGPHSVPHPAPPKSSPFQGEVAAKRSEGAHLVPPPAPKVLPLPGGGGREAVGGGPQQSLPPQSPPPSRGRWPRSGRRGPHSVPPPPKSSPFQGEVAAKRSEGAHLVPPPAPKVLPLPGGGGREAVGGGPQRALPPPQTAPATKSRARCANP